MSNIDLAAIFRKYGNRHTVHGNPATFVRSGTFTPQGQMVHHTVTTARQSAVVATTVLAVRPDVPPPRCNIVVERDGTLVVISNGRAADSGKGNKAALDAVMKDQPVRWTRQQHADDYDGTAWWIDWEVANNGVDEPYPDAQITGLCRGLAAVNLAKGWSPNRIVHHRQHTRRKVDMSWQGDIWGAVALHMLNLAGFKPGPGPAPIVEDDVAPKPTAHMDRIWGRNGELGGHYLLTADGGVHSRAGGNEPDGPRFWGSYPGLKDEFKTMPPGEWFVKIWLEGGGYTAMRTDGIVHHFGPTTQHLLK